MPSEGVAGTGGATDAGRILEFARACRREEIVRRRGRLWAARAWLLAPVRSAREAAVAVRSYGAVTKEDSGVSLIRQFLWTWWLSARYGYGADTIYRFRLFDASRVLPRPGFAHWHDAALLFRAVGERMAPDAIETLADKRNFATWCESHALPTVPIIREFEGGAMTRDRVDDGRGPSTDLFAKWGTQYGGDDTQCWRFADGSYLDEDGRTWSFTAITDALTERSRRGVVLLQPRLRNHAALRRIAPHALSTVRVMTTRAPGENPRVLATVLRMGTGKATADNFAQGGIASAVDVSTGIAGIARQLDEIHRTRTFVRHPDTDAQIEGFRVPYWAEVLSLAIDAHERLGAIACVGWDVAVVEDGPILLEGNWNPCTKLLQVATQTPLLKTDFSRTFSAWLAALEHDTAR